MISQRAQNIVASVTGELSAKVTELKAQGKDVIKLNIGEPDVRPPENIAEAAIAAIEEGFSKYVAIFGDSSAIYGSVTSIALAMLWLYICMSIVFYGGGINRYLMDIGFQIKTRRARKRIAEARAAQAEREEQEAEPAPDAEKKQEEI